MSRPLIAPAALTAAGAALAASHLWAGNLGPTMLGAALTGVALAWLVRVLRRSPDHRRQVELIRRLWATARRLPADTVLSDPLTDHSLWVERRRGFVTLATLDPGEEATPGNGRDALVTRYLLGFWTAPLPPPLVRHVCGLDEPPPERMSWREAMEVSRLNETTGAMETPTDELLHLLEQIDRAVAV